MLNVGFSLHLFNVKSSQINFYPILMSYYENKIQLTIYSAGNKPKHTLKRIFI